MEPTEGFEPPTSCLQNNRSTPELRRRGTLSLAGRKRLSLFAGSGTLGQLLCPQGRVILLSDSTLLALLKLAGAADMIPLRFIELKIVRPIFLASLASSLHNVFVVKAQGVLPLYGYPQRVQSEQQTQHKCYPAD